MKTAAAIFYAILVMISAFSCRGDYVERNMDLSDKLCGRYTYGSDETEDSETLEISYINGNLILEVSEHYAAYYASELTDYDPEVFADFNADEITVTAHTFSGFSNEGKYWEPENYTIKITEDGITLVYGDGSTKSYIRDEESAPIHNPAQYYTELTGNIFDTELIGEWKYTDDSSSLYIIMKENGSYTFCGKQGGEPINISIGAFSSVDNTLNTICERCGYANMPFFETYAYTLDDDTLTLTTDQEAITLTKTTK